MHNISLSHTLSSLLEGSVPVYRGQSKHDIPACAGIYVLLCTVNGKPYVGRSVNLRNRFGEHHKPTYSHYNGKKLSNAKKKHGQHSFVFYVVETCDVEDLHEREIFYIKELDSVRCGYNTRYDSEDAVMWSPDEDTRNKISQSLKEYYEENENPWKGKKHSDESRELIKKNMRNEDGTLKAEQTGESLKKKVVMIDKNTDQELITFLSLADANIFLGKKRKHCSAIGHAASGRNKTSSGFKWKYLNSKTTLEEN